MPKDLSSNDIRSALQDALNAGLPKNQSVWIRDVYPYTNKVVYRLEQNDPSYKELALYERTFTIVDDPKSDITLTLSEPVQVVQVTSYEPVVKAKAAFSVGAVAENGAAYGGKIFEVASYPDKEFDLTLDDATAAMNAFLGPIPLSIEHVKSPLDGKLGFLTGFSLSGNDLIGTATLSPWVKEVLGDEISISTEWDRSTKQIVGASLVLDPRVTDAKIAAMSAKFSQSEAPKVPAVRKEETEMKPEIVQLFVKLWAGAEKASFSDEERAAVEKELGETATFSQTSRELGAEAAAISVKADAFVEGAVKSNKVVPAGSESLKKLFCWAVRADSDGKACFTVEGALNEGDKVGALKSFVEALPSHDLTTAKTPAAFSKEEQETEDAEVERLANLVR